MSSIEASGLTKRYGRVLAVGEVSSRVEPADIYALLGLNGAGKTTLIRMLLGMITPTGGTVSVLGAAVGLGERSAWARTATWWKRPPPIPN
ncbi:ATP-binding cassette domain-containing protein [Streptosporangium sp. DT93]|uniref:ATP-binding cassette domain-containing protein n=1 Tax=Streptosporangium sp. DT93 TaxID=3393428 RepID=UPI003CE90562